MNPDSSNLRHRQDLDQNTELHQDQQSKSGQEFGSVEEIIRCDASQTQPPETIAERLKESLAREPAPARPWWRWLFGR